MTWHTLTIQSEALHSALTEIGREGGVVTASVPCELGYVLTYVTKD